MILEISKWEANGFIVNNNLKKERFIKLMRNLNTMYLYIMSVSYTHLDVYKRQVTHYGKFILIYIIKLYTKQHILHSSTVLMKQNAKQVPKYRTSIYSWLFKHLYYKKEKTNKMIYNLSEYKNKVKGTSDFNLKCTFKDWECGFWHETKL